jgi:methylmalonyl-CoA epimerase
MAVTRLDHVAVAVHDPTPATHLYGDLLGGRYVQGVPDHKGFGFIQFEYPNGSRLEVIFPASDGDGFLPQFLRKRGEGLHHITYGVDDLAAEVERFRDQGYRVVDENYTDPRWQEAFLSPTTTGGVLIQLAQSSLPLSGQDERWRGNALERVLELAAQGR